MAMNEVFQHSPKQLDRDRVDVLSNHRIKIKQLGVQSNGHERGIPTFAEKTVQSGGE